MSDKHNDINDDEIRIISSTDAGSHNRVRPVYIVWACVAALLIIVGLAVIFFSASDEIEIQEVQPPIEETVALKLPEKETNTQQPGHVVLSDTTINGAKLRLLCPENATPSLEVGADVLADTSIVMALQAADIRRDNGKIVGTCVVGGELRSKGEAKAGFCSIINGEITVGVADATPKLEEALMNNGYFFRQYPLVVGGQIVENKPKGRAIRKALAELDGRIYAVSSLERMSFHDFSQALVDLGIRNAIYLVGANSCGLYRDAQGKVFTFGTIPSEQLANINYIIWR